MVRAEGVTGSLQELGWGSDPIGHFKNLTFPSSEIEVIPIMLIED